LIVGESGTGKELVANAIHYSSLRSKKAFVKINCAALPKDLIESELFGRAKGAYTGAVSDSEGLVGRAAGGSLLLDEITEMPIDLQPKLLRVLQEHSYQRLGETKITEVDFRLICSTNRSASEAISSGLLRQDLYYRISTITIELPPLRKRVEDIQLLADHFLRLYSEKYQKSLRTFSQEAYERVCGHNWPGNVRELEHVVERAVLLSKTNEISSDELPLPQPQQQRPQQAPAQNRQLTIPPNMTLEEIEKQAVLQTLQHTKGNKQAAAAILGIYRPLLYAKIKKHKLSEFSGGE